MREPSLCLTAHCCLKMLSVLRCASAVRTGAAAGLRLQRPLMPGAASMLHTGGFCPGTRAVGFAPPPGISLELLQGPPPAAARSPPTAAPV